MTSRVTTKQKWFAVLPISLLAGCLYGQVDGPTPLQTQIYKNIDKLESRLVLDHEQYLPRETVRVTVTMRNPTNEPLVIPQPFHQRTGRCYMVIRGTVAPGLFGDEGVKEAGFHPIFWNVPTVVLQPQQEVTQTVTFRDLRVWYQLEIPDRPGEWRMKYSYDERMRADFSVVRPTKLWAVDVVHLRPSEEMEYGKLVTRSSVVPFLVIETTPGEYWLFRGDPLRDELTPWPRTEYTLDVLYSQIHFFERVKQLDEAVVKLRAELKADDTVQVIGETTTSRQIELRVPSRPARAIANAK